MTMTGTGSEVATPIAKVLDLLDVIPGPDQHQWMARCPAHDDRVPSLSVAESEEGIVLLWCFAGCPTEKVVRRLGLRWRDLWPCALIGSPEWERQHVYTLESGEPHYKVCKRRFPRGHNRFATMRFDPTSATGWSAGLGDSIRILYLLPQLASGDGVVWCVEGEKDAETACSLGATATSAAFNDWGGTDLTLLVDRECLVVCDHDAAGWHHGMKRAVAVEQAGAIVLGVVWPEHDKDLSDLAERVASMEEVVGELSPIPGAPPRKAVRTFKERASSYAVVPTEALQVSPDAQALYVMMDMLAGPTTVARLSIADYARYRQVCKGTAGRWFRSLEDANLIVNIRRAQWRVINLGRKGKSESHAIVPRRVLDLSPEAQAIFARLDQDAGVAGVTKFSGNQYAKDYSIGRNTVAVALDDLRHAGLIEPEGRVAYWRVINPSRPSAGRRLNVSTHCS